MLSFQGWGLWPLKALETPYLSLVLKPKDPKLSSFLGTPICHHRVKLLLWFLHNHIWSPLNTSPCCQMGSWGIDPFLAVGVSLPLGVSGDSMGNLSVYPYLVAMRCPSSSWLWLPEETKWTGRIFTTTWFNKAKKITRDKRGCYVTMKNSIYQAQQS